MSRRQEGNYPSTTARKRKGSEKGACEILKAKAHPRLLLHILLCARVFILTRVKVLVSTSHSPSRQYIFISPRLSARKHCAMEGCCARAHKSREITRVVYWRWKNSREGGLTRKKGAFHCILRSVPLAVCQCARTYVCVCVCIRQTEIGLIPRALYIR